MGKKRARVVRTNGGDCGGAGDVRTPKVKIQIGDEYYTQTWLRKIIDKVKYKEGWTLNMVMENKDTVAIHWTCRGLHATHPERGIVDIIGRQTCVKLWWSETFLVHEIFLMAQEMEIHECAEFFRYKGVRVYNPHTDIDKLVKVGEVEV